MLWCTARHALKVIATGVAVATFTSTPYVAAAQRDATVDRQQQSLEQIQDILSRGGPYSAELLEPLTALSVLYQEDNDETSAAAVVERALQIVRVNDGLYSLDQVPFVQQLIRVEKARSNDATAWELEQDLARLVRRHPDDPRTVPTLRAIADRQMSTLQGYLRGEQPAELFLGCYYDPFPEARGGSCTAGTRKTVVQGMLADAQRSYADAVAVLLRNEQYDSEELREIELELLRGADMVRTMYGTKTSDRALMIPYTSQGRGELWHNRTEPIHQLASWDLPYLDGTTTRDRAGEPAVINGRLDDPYYRGRQSLGRLYAYGAAASSPLLRQVDALVQLADWDLLYARNGTALPGYEAAYRWLKDAGAGQPSIDEFFLPQLPVVLPAFQPNPLARDVTKTATGRIDVEFVITKFGRSRRVEIVDSSNASKGDEDRLVDLIVHSRFRPRPLNGQVADAAPVLVHYYIQD